MIDVHAHVLPGIDDGATDLDESLAMARQWVAEGVTGVVATVHSAEALASGLTSDAMRRSAGEMQSWLRARSVELTIYPGCEVFGESESLTWVRDGRLATLNGSRYVLIEAPMTYLPPYFDRLLYDFQAAGYVPIVAHPERNAGVVEKPGKLRDWAERGMLNQITAGSILGKHGRKSQHLARVAIQRRWIHLVASDAHGAVVRTPSLAAARAEVAALAGEEEARRLFLEVPRSIIDDELIETRPPDDEPAPKSRWFGLLRDRDV